MRHRLLLAASVLLFLGVLALAGALFLVDPFTPRRRLPDGTTLYLDAVTSGSQTAEWVDGAPWVRAIAPILPDDVRKRLGWRTRRLGLQGRLTFWVRQLGGPRTSIAGGHRFEVAEFYDENGNSAAFPVYLTRFRKGEPAAIGADTFPRRGSSVGLRLWRQVGTGRWHDLGGFARPNPHPGPYPVWRPDPIPATRRAAGRSVTLQSLSIAPRFLVGHPTLYHTDVAASFRITHRGAPESGWEAVEVSLRDATGNSYRLTNFRHQPGPGAGAAFGARRPAAPPASCDYWGGAQAIVPGEALRMRVSLVKSRRATFGPDDTWTVRDLPLPGPSWRRGPLSEARRGGLALEMVGVAGPFDRRPRGDPFNARIHVNVRGRGGERLIALGAKDDRGRPVEVAGYASTGTGSLGLAVEPDARRVNITFAIQKPLVVEYLVPPVAAIRSAAVR